MLFFGSARRDRARVLRGSPTQHAAVGEKAIDAGQDLQHGA